MSIACSMSSAASILESNEMMKGVCHFIILSLYGSLLFLLPQGAMGQTTVALQPSSPAERLEKFAEKVRHTEWQQGPHRLTLPNGVSDVLSMNYVDGYSVGPHFIYSHLNNDRSGWEVEPTVRWAFSRNCMVAKASLRYLWPVEQQRFVALYGGQTMEDFDEEPVMPMQHSLMASGLFGWNHYKLVERTQAGLRASTPMGGALQLTGDVRWERRRAKQNHTGHNLFGVEAQSNVPRIRDVADEPHLTLYDGPVEAELVKVGLQLDVLANKVLYVQDEWTAVALSSSPHFILKAEAGQGVGQRWSSMRFASLDFGVRQALKLERWEDQLRYHLGLGAMWHEGEVGLADWHHLDASTFWWQCTDGLTHFALLDNYELSTDRWWSEAHVEWSSPCMLLTQLTQTSDFRETLQLHLAHVAGRQTHWECWYGWDLLGQMKLGVTLGFDNWRYAGMAYGLVLII